MTSSKADIVALERALASWALTSHEHDAGAAGPDPAPSRIVRFKGSDAGSIAQRDPNRAVGYPESSFGWSFWNMSEERGRVLKPPRFDEKQTKAITDFNTKAYEKHRETGVDQLCWHCDQATLDLDNESFIMPMITDQPATKSFVERYQKRRALLHLDQIQNHSRFCSLCRLVNSAAQSFPELRDNPYGVAVGMCLTNDTIWTDVPGGFSEHSLSSQALSLKLLIMFECPPGLLDITREPMIRSNPKDVKASLLRVDDDPVTMSSRFGRRVDPEAINHRLLKKWLMICERHHGPICAKEAPIAVVEGVSSELTVIDVVNMKLKKISWDDKYLALSYVWGKDNINFRATRNNTKLLYTQGGISQVLDQVPWTVKDAITLVTAIGERYLWVDAMCIIQDDHMSKKKAIDSMSIIYSKAFITIIAASGSDANAGLPGIRKGTRSLNAAANIKPGLTLMLDQTGLEQDRTDATYWTRAWTYQEQKLSTRTITFANNRVYWNCRTMNAQEDIANNEDALVAEREAPIRWRGSYYDLDETPDNFSQYTRLVETYSQMKLGHSIDAINAFRGISDILTYRAKGSTYGGLPVEWFDLALLWEPVAGATRRPEHPSWSWAGWAGPIDHLWKEGYVPHIEDSWFRKVWMQKARWIKWFGEGADGHSIGLLPATKEQYPDVEIEGTIADFGELAEGATADEVMGGIHVNFRRNSTPQERKILSSYDQYRNLLEHSLGLAHDNHTFTPVASPHNLNTGKEGLEDQQINQSHRSDTGKRKRLAAPASTSKLQNKLLLRLSSVVAHFRLQPFKGKQWGWGYESSPGHYSYDVFDASEPENHSPGLSKFNIINNQDHWCGTIILNSCWWTPEKASAIFPFIVLSDAVSWTRVEYPEFLKMTRPPIRDELTWRMEDLHRKGESPYYVMLVEWHGDYAERVGIGKVFKKALSQSCKPGAQWQEIVVQ